MLEYAIAVGQSISLVLESRKTDLLVLIEDVQRFYRTHIRANAVSVPSGVIEK